MRPRSIQVAAGIFCCTSAATVLPLFAGSAWATIPTPTLCPTMTPVPTPTSMPAVIINSSAAVKHDQPFVSQFRLNESIERPFTAYAVVVMPDKTMLNARPIDPSIRPVASNIQVLNAPFTYDLLSLNVPERAPLGDYEVLAGFFSPGKPITGPDDAFLLARGPFSVVDVVPSPTPTPLPDLSGPWKGSYHITAPTPCAGGSGTWVACIRMDPDGKLSGTFGTSGTPPVNGDLSGTYDDGTAKWTVEGESGISFTGVIEMNGRTISGTFKDGPECGPPGSARVSGTFEGIIL